MKHNLASCGRPTLAYSDSFRSSSAPRNVVALPESAVRRAHRDMLVPLTLQVQAMEHQRD
eukprot:15276265-Alexandrium_andersonii.AAC.1